MPLGKKSTAGPSATPLVKTNQAVVGDLRRVLPATDQVALTNRLQFPAALLAERLSVTHFYDGLIVTANHPVADARAGSLKQRVTGNR